MPVRQLCQAMTETLNGISPDNNIILGDLNINWLVETERRPIYNLLVRDNGYKQFISSYTTDNKTLIDHIYTNILHLDYTVWCCGNIFHRSQGSLGFISH